MMFKKIQHQTISSARADINSLHFEINHCLVCRTIFLFIFVYTVTKIFFSCFHNIFLKIRINNSMAGYLAGMDRDEKYILKWIYKCKRPQFFVLQLTGAIFFFETSESVIGASCINILLFRSNFTIMFVTVPKQNFRQMTEEKSPPPHSTSPFYKYTQSIIYHLLIWIDAEHNLFIVYNLLYKVHFEFVV